MAQACPHGGLQGVSHGFASVRCDRCRTTIPARRHSSYIYVYSCRKCNYDLCPSCYQQQQPNQHQQYQHQHQQNSASQHVYTPAVVPRPPVQNQLNPRQKLCASNILRYAVCFIIFLIIILYAVGGNILSGLNLSIEYLLYYIGGITYGIIIMIISICLAYLGHKDKKDQDIMKETYIHQNQQRKQMKKNIQTYVNVPQAIAMEQEEKLPDGCRKSYTKDNKVYYQNDQTQQTKWQRPEEKVEEEIELFAPGVVNVIEKQDEPGDVIENEIVNQNVIEIENNDDIEPMFLEQISIMDVRQLEGVGK